MEQSRFEKQLAFITEIDKLKYIQRKTRLFNSPRHENDAEHSWHLAMMVWVLSEHANAEVDLMKVLKMVLIHDIVEIDALITELEKARGVEVGSTEIVLMLESAKSFWNADTLGRASSRITAMGVGRIDLSMMLGAVPQNEFRLYRFLMTRTLVAARMLGKQPLGAFWRPGSRGGLASVADTLRAAREARLLGFSGCVCAVAEQVEPVHAGFV